MDWVRQVSTAVAASWARRFRRSLPLRLRMPTLPSRRRQHQERRATAEAVTTTSTRQCSQVSAPAARIWTRIRCRAEQRKMCTRPRYRVIQQMFKLVSSIGIWSRRGGGSVMGYMQRFGGVWGVSMVTIMTDDTWQRPERRITLDVQCAKDTNGMSPGGPYFQSWNEFSGPSLDD